jgi:integrase
MASKPARRAKGSGYVASKPRADGLWPGGVTLPDGTPKRLYGKTQAEIRAKVAAEIQKIAEGRPGRARDALVRDFLPDWLERRRRTGKGLATSTVQRYEELISLHVLPSLGGRRVSSLTFKDLERLYDDLRARGLSESTVHRVHSMLHTALKDAVRRGDLGHNPCDLIDAPSDTPRPRRVLDIDQVIRYLRTATGDPNEALLVLAAESGLRQGQLIALRIDDVDLDAATLASPEKVRYVPGYGMVRSRPKTAAGDVKIAIGGWSVAALRVHIAALAASGQPNPLGLLFPSTVGSHLRPPNWNRRVWRPFLKRAGIDETVQFRELTRKVHASIAVAAGVDPATLRDRMGHADVETTLGHYAYVVTEADRQAARRIDAELRKLARRKPSDERTGQDSGQMSNGISGTAGADSKEA